MKVLITFLFMSILFISCNKKENYSIKEELEVINDTFLKLPFITEGYKTFPPIPEPTYEGDLELEKKGKEYDINVNKLFEKAKAMGYDLNRIQMNCSDTLFQQTRGGSKNNSANMAKKHSYNRYLIDSSYSKPIKDFLYNKKKTEPFNLSVITSTGNYNLVPTKSLPRKIYDKWPDYDYNYGGYIRFSRVYFTEDMKYAVYEYYYYFMNDASNCYLIYCEKVNDKWEIKHTLLTMIQ